jgi:hypothetical protein
MKPLRGAFLWLFVVGAAAALACSSSSAPAGCESNPFACPAGQTCWSRNGPGDFACLPSGNATTGQGCQPAAGVAGCADRLVCVAAPESAAGPSVCRAYCDGSHGCGSGETCTRATFDGTHFISFCYAAPTPGDGGDPCPIPDGSIDVSSPDGSTDDSSPDGRGDDGPNEGGE